MYLSAPFNLATGRGGREAPSNRRMVAGALTMLGVVAFFCFLMLMFALNGSDSPRPPKSTTTPSYPSPSYSGGSSYSPPSYSGGYSSPGYGGSTNSVDPFGRNTSNDPFNRNTSTNDPWGAGRTSPTTPRVPSYSPSVPRPSYPSPSRSYTPSNPSPSRGYTPSYSPPSPGGYSPPSSPGGRP